MLASKSRKRQILCLMFLFVCNGLTLHLYQGVIRSNIDIFRSFAAHGWFHHDIHDDHDVEASPLFAKSGRMATRMPRIRTDFDSPSARPFPPATEKNPFLSVVSVASVLPSCRFGWVKSSREAVSSYHFFTNQISEFRIPNSKPRISAKPFNLPMAE